MLTTVLQQLLIFCCDREPKIWTSERIVGFFFGNLNTRFYKKTHFYSSAAYPPLLMSAITGLH